MSKAVYGSGVLIFSCDYQYSLIVTDTVRLHVALTAWQLLGPAAAWAATDIIAKMRVGVR